MDGDQRLARADVALEDVHRLRRGHRGRDLLDRAELRLRGLERDGREEALAELRLGIVGHAGPSASIRCLRNATPSSR